VTIPAYVSVNPDSPRAARFGGGDASQANSRRKERLDAIKDEFKLALTYDKVVRDALAQHAVPPTPDPRLAALVPYAKGEKPVIFKAERRVEILDALKMASELKLKAVISGGGEAWKVADALKSANVPVILNGTLRLPSDSSDPYDAPYATAAKLFAAGVTFAIKSGGGDTGTAGRNLPYEAATAVAFGLPEAEGLKSVTLAPAQILGVADKLGSLDVGKRADLVICAGGMLQPTAEVKGLFVGGKPLPPESRHTKLYAKYRQRLVEVRAGTAALGLDRTSPTAAAPAPATASPVRGEDR
jgi:imidazolonepropionase-like amidohydrolase